jgi:hypothetical protein
MEKDLKDVWTGRYGNPDAARAGWITELKEGGLPILPSGFENSRQAKDFKAKNKPPFPATVSGFVSAAKKASALSGKDDALQKLALNKSYYLSPKMLVGVAGPSATKDGGKIGKPSMFYLLMFAENVYDAKNRAHGTTAGGEPELQASQVPIASFLSGGYRVLA